MYLRSFAGGLIAGMVLAATILSLLYFAGKIVTDMYWSFFAGLIVGVIPPTIAVVGSIYNDWKRRRQERRVEEIRFYRGIIDPFFTPLFLGLESIDLLFRNYEEKSLSERKEGIERAKQEIENPPFAHAGDGRTIAYVKDYEAFLPSLKEHRDRVIEALKELEKKADSKDAQKRVTEAQKLMRSYLYYFLGLGEII
jgi:hypothetical protein